MEAENIFTLLNQVIKTSDYRFNHPTRVTKQEKAEWYFYENGRNIAKTWIAKCEERGIFPAHYTTAADYFLWFAETEQAKDFLSEMSLPQTWRETALTPEFLAMYNKFEHGFMAGLLQSMQLIHPLIVKQTSNP